MKNKSILVIGVQPPPLGGVSIYVRRRCKLLELQGNSVFTFTSNPTLPAFISFVFRSFKFHYDLVEINSIQFVWVIVIRLLFPRTYIVVIDHNHSRRFQKTNALLRFIISLGMLLADRIDLVRESLVENYASLFFNQRLKFGYRDPYIQPTDDEEALAIKTWPKSLLDFVDHQDKIIISCASSLELVKDTYKFNDCIIAFAMVKEVCPDAKLVLVSSICEPSYYQKSINLITELNLNDSIYFQVGVVEIWPLFKRARAFLRITTTDGDSVSVKEALSYNCKVIASNVIPRPKNVFLVKPNDTDQIAANIIAILEK